jgi:hypothetical protein
MLKLKLFRSRTRPSQTGINSMLSVLSMVFFMITDAGVRILLSGIRIFKPSFGLKVNGQKKSQGFFGGILEYIDMFLI